MQAGSYQLKIKNKMCALESNQIIIKTPFLDVKDKKMNFPGEVILKVKGGSGNYAWFLTEVGGTVLSEGDVFKPYIKRSITYYVEDLGEKKCKRTPVAVILKE